MTTISTAFPKVKDNPFVKKLGKKPKKKSRSHTRSQSISLPPSASLENNNETGSTTSDVKSYTDEVIKGLNDQIDDQNLEIETLRNQLDQMEHRINDEQKINETLEAENVSLRDKIKNLDSKQLQNRQDLETDARIVETQKKMISDLKKELRCKNKTIRDQSARIGRQSGQLQTSNTVKNALDELRSELAVKNQELESVTRQLMKEKANIETLKSTLDGNIRLLNTERKKCQAHEASLSTLKEKISSLTVELNKGSGLSLNAVEQPAELNQLGQLPPLKFNKEQYEELNRKHAGILSGWSSSTLDLQKACPDALTDDDEKEDLSGATLLDKFCVIQSLIVFQASRIKLVQTNEHLVQVMNSHQSLSDLLQAQDLLCKNNASALSEFDGEYEGLKQQRVELQERIKSMVATCNELITRENTMVKKRNGLIIDKQLNELDRQNITKMVTDSWHVIESYNEFMETNRKLIEKTIHHFDALWAQFERRFRSWTSADVASWFQHKTSDMDIVKVDWTKVAEELDRRNIAGASLQQFNQVIFEFIGIHDFNVAQRLMSSIETLKEGKEMQQSVRVRAVQPKPDNTGVPDEHICPITKEVMQDPVIAFDGHCYEKVAIEEYLKTHHKSPVTGAKAEYTVVFPNHRLRAEIRKAMDSKDGGITDEGITD